ncbi:MAG: hypothetical protein ACFFA7_13115 [Promethearchaeota archaeon]
MENSNEMSDEKFWTSKIKEHWKVFIVVIIAGVCLILGAITVIFWYINSSPIGNYGAWTLDQWTLDALLASFILIFLWELLFIGVPAGLFFSIGGYLFWRRLPEEEKQAFKSREKNRKNAKTAGGGGGGGFFMFLAYCIYHGVNGTFHTTFGTFGYAFWVSTFFLTVMWIVIVIGIPVAIILLIVYFAYWRKKTK